MPRIFRILAAVLTFAGLLAPLTASAQNPEKRIALVIGNAAYPDHVLPTAANDAGLIAQTLQAAGFDVIGARDLDADSLRRSLKDFVQKAEASGPDTVAFLYLAGYGMQLAGENYFVPNDAAPARDTDVATETLRISDYVRQIQALPLKAGIVVLDAARDMPFAKAGQPVAGGLALVEPDPKIFIAYNAAPGTIAPESNTSYGPYAQALAEMIRTGGLTLPEVFDRTRLRVNDVTKGAQVPWDTRTIDAQIIFFERAPDAPPLAAAPAEQNKPIAAYDANAAYTAAVARDTLPDYTAFVAAYPNDPLAKRVRALIAARREAVTWRRSYLVNTPEAYWSYLQRYPRGPHAYDARRRLAYLTAPVEPPPSFATIAYDVPPPPPEEIVYVERPVVLFSDPFYAFAPPPPPPVYFLPPPPPDFVILAPPPPVFGFFVLPRPIFVPFPVYVVAPRYVLPPQNNIIFANIHNTTVINNVINKPAPPVPPVGAQTGQTGNPGGGPALPPAVAQKASLIQQGKLPPPSSMAKPAALSSPGTAATGAVAGGNAARLGQPLPGANGQPLPATARPGVVEGAPKAPNAAAKGPATPQTAMATPGRPSVGPPRPQGITRPGASSGPSPQVSALRPQAPPQNMRPAARPQPPAMHAPVQAMPRPQPQFQRPPPMQAMARPMPQRMAPPPRMMRPAPRGCPPGARCR